MQTSPKISNMFFCNISKGKDVLFSYNGGDLEIEKLASVWQEKAPAHHAWHSHTKGKMTFGFLMEDGYIYFAINDHKGNLENLQFLKNLQDCFLKMNKKDEFQDELSAAIHRMESSEGMYSPLASAEYTTPHDRKKKKDRGIEVGEHNLDYTGVKIDAAQEHDIGIAISSRSSSLSSKIRPQQHARRLWWRHVKIVAAVDALLCLGLFVAWLVVCRGFQCLS